MAPSKKKRKHPTSSLLSPSRPSQPYQPDSSSLLVSGSGVGVVTNIQNSPPLSKKRQQGRHSQASEIKSNIDPFVDNADSLDVSYVATSNRIVEMESNELGVAAKMGKYSDDSEVDEYHEEAERKQPPNTKYKNDYTDSDILDDDNLIAKQKQRAIELWNKSNYDESMKGSVHDKVIQQLEKGLVLPIFHILCQNPSQRLYAPNTKVSATDDDFIHLSPDDVSMGECTAGTLGKISIEPEASYISSFFAKDGNGNSEVQDYVGDPNWVYSKHYTNVVTALVNESAQMKGEDIEVTKLVSKLEIDIQSGSNLITRRQSRGVVADCFSRSESGSTYAIVGSPGIGKSWSLVYALQQALLYENACVMFCFQKDGRAIICIRRNNKIFAWVQSSKSLNSGCQSNLFSNSNVVVLLDPRESTEGGAAFSQGRRRLIMAASNNKVHFGNIYKITAKFARYLSMYTDRELLVALRHMTTDPKQLPPIKDIMARATDVGNLPRSIISIEKYEDRKNLADISSESLAESVLKKINNWKGITGTKEGDTIAGCIFAVNVYHDLSQPEKVGYDGQSVKDYNEIMLSLMSESVLTIIEKSNRENILSFWAMVSDAKLSAMGKMVENLFWNDLKNHNTMKVFSMIRKEEQDLPIGKCKMIDNCQINELGTKIFNATSATICRMKERTALVDFAGPGQRVYQVTVSETHDMSDVGLKELFLASGHCVLTSNGTIVPSDTASTMKQIEFYWVIPYGKKSVWKKKKPKFKKKGNVLKDFVDNYIEQYVLVLEIDPVQTSDNA